jgi:hypothetical protein
VSVLVSVWTPTPPKLMLHTQLELEAEVGIERSLRRQSASNTLIAGLFLPLFYRGFKHFLMLSANYLTYPVTYPLLVLCNRDIFTMRSTVQSPCAGQEQAGHCKPETVTLH